MVRSSHTRRNIRMRLPAIVWDKDGGDIFESYWKFSPEAGLIILLVSCYAFPKPSTSRWNYHFHEMRAQNTRFQQMLKIRRTTLGFGVVQILLGVSLTALSFIAFAFTSSNRIRNACPYWAGFTVGLSSFHLTKLCSCEFSAGVIWTDKLYASVFFIRFFAAEV